MMTIKVKEYTKVDFRRCSQEALDSFGSLEALKVDGGLYLVGCTGLMRLPDGLKVNRGLYLVGCTGLTKLPDGLNVRHRLEVTWCSGITKLPYDLHVGGYIYYNSKTGFYGHEDEPGVIPERLKHKLYKF
jgi:hypothetical protein